MLNISKREDYDKIIESLSKCLNYYNRSYSKDNTYIIYLASGKVINYSIKENNLAHMLGIKIDNLISKSILKKDNHYNILLDFITNSYSIYKRILSQEGYISYGDIFSDYVNEKLDIFYEQLKNPNPSDILFVCEYDTKRTYQVKEFDEYTSDYYIARKDTKGNIIILGLTKGKHGDYVVQTSRVIKNDENKNKILREFLNNQVVTYVNTLKIENYQNGYDKTIHLGIDDKKEVIKNLIDISNITGSLPCTIKNHLFDIVGVSRMKTENFNKKVILSQFIESMKENKIFDISDLDQEIIQSVDDATKDVIDNYNDYICSKYSSNDDNNKKYSDLSRKKNDLLEKNEILSEELKKLKEEKLELERQKEELQHYKEDYLNFTSKIYSMVDEEKAKNEI